MIEVELKAVVDDLDALRRRIEGLGAALRIAGRLEDRRYDRGDHSLAAKDQVFRLRAYRDASGREQTASLDWKGPTSLDGGYKNREELSTTVASFDETARILECVGFVVTMAIDREIWQYELHGAVVRFERYPRMDDLVEVEGMPSAIERAIVSLGIPRNAFTAERLPSFVRRFEERTGERAALSDAELAGTVRYDLNDA